MITKDKVFIERKNLKHLIEFYDNDNSDNPLAEESFRRVFFCFAEVLPLSGTSFATIDSMDFGHITTENLVIFKIRFMSNISNKWRIKFDNKDFEIKKITDLAFERKVLQIIAQGVE